MTSGVEPPPAKRRRPATAGRDHRDGLAVMSVVEHLEDLRRTLVFMIAVATVAGVGGWFAAPWALDAIVTPRVDRVYFSAPSEGFMIRLKVSLAIGLLVALPAVAAFNAFQRLVRSRLGQADVLRHEVLSYLKGERQPTAAE